MNATELAERFPHLLPYGNLLLLVLGSWVCFFLGRLILSQFLRPLANALSGIWVQTFMNQRFLSQVSWAVPVTIIFFGVHSITGLPTTVSTLVERITLASLVVIALRSVTTLLNNVNDTYMGLEISRHRPIKGFIQVALIILYLLALILIVSILLDRSPWVFLSGLGAMTAILILVFRDTLLSLVAGFQLTSNNLIRVGDWIEMPQFGADGDVVDLALHTVRVQNWDKTITIIPTHKFLEHSFKNWRGMHESGGRRIKRSIHVDMSTVRFLTEEEIQKLSRFMLLKDYMKQKISDLKKHNADYDNDPNLIVNSRRLTNVGTFRAYLSHYLRQHPGIHKNMTFLVRHLAPGPQGLPIEIYVFTNDTRWAVYEGIQADIFDHIIAIAPEFGLRIFQNPSGSDLRELKN